MSWKDYPVSCFADALRSTVGGVLAFFLGLVGGSLIVFSQEIAGLRFEWTAFLVAWLVLLPYTVIKLWGLLLLPLLGMVFYGLVWRDWNRLVCAALTALAFSATVLGCARHNPFATRESAIPFAIAMGAAFLVLATGVAGAVLARSHLLKPKPPDDPCPT